MCPTGSAPDSPATWAAPGAVVLPSSRRRVLLCAMWLGSSCLPRPMSSATSSTHSPRTGCWESTVSYERQRLRFATLTVDGIPTSSSRDGRGRAEVGKEFFVSPFNDVVRTVCRATCALPSGSPPPWHCTTTRVRSCWPRRGPGPRDQAESREPVTAPPWRNESQSSSAGTASASGPGRLPVRTRRRFTDDCPDPYLPGLTDVRLAGHLAVGWPRRWSARAVRDLPVRVRAPGGEVLGGGDATSPVPEVPRDPDRLASSAGGSPEDRSG